MCRPTMKEGIPIATAVAAAVAAKSDPALSFFFSLVTGETFFVIEYRYQWYPLGLVVLHTVIRVASVYRSNHISKQTL